MIGKEQQRLGHTQKIQEVACSMNCKPEQVSVTCQIRQKGNAKIGKITAEINTSNNLIMLVIVVCYCIVRLLERGRH